MSNPNKENAVSRKFFSNLIIGMLSCSLAGFAGAADRKEADGHRKEDIANHRAMALVHENAAKCLEAGKPHKDCQEQLQKECKGLGIGKYCGMKHKH
jgi:hypothetical protein